jgi:hypothetical protein
VTKSSTSQSIFAECVREPPRKTKLSCVLFVKHISFRATSYSFKGSLADKFTCIIPPSMLSTKQGLSYAGCLAQSTSACSYVTRTSGNNFRKETSRNHGSREICFAQKPLRTIPHRPNCFRIKSWILLSSVKVSLCATADEPGRTALSALLSSASFMSKSILSNHCSL